MGWVDSERRKEYFKTYEQVNNEKLKLQRRLAHVKRNYNLNAQDYLELINIQDNKCAICYKEETYKNKYGDTRPLAVDHCHTTGKVRGLLCTHCNSMLGHSQDNINTLQNAIKYLLNQSGD